MADQKPLVEVAGEQQRLQPPDGLDVALERLVDVPAYSGNHDKALHVNSDGNGLEWRSSIGASLGTVMKFSSTVTMADPGSGEWRMNNATQPNSTALAVSGINEDGQDISDILADIKSGATIYLQEVAQNQSDRFHIFDVTADAIDNGSWVQLNGEVSSSGGSALRDGKECSLTIFAGSSGALEAHNTNTDAHANLPIENLASTGNDGQVAMATGAGGLFLSNSVIQNSKTGLVDVMTNLLSISAGDPAEIEVRASQGTVVSFDPDPENPTMVDLVWAVPFENIALPGLAANLVTAVYVVDSGGGVPAIELSNTAPGPVERRTKLLIGFAFHAGATVVDAVDSTGVTEWDTGSSLDDLYDALGNFNLFGNIYSANGANLLLNKSAGLTAGRGLNPGNINDPNRLPSDLQTGITAYAYSYRDGSGGFTPANEVAIDPDNYDDGTGTLASTTNKYTIQRLVFTPRSGGLTAVEYGQKLYNTLNEAIDGIAENGVIKNPVLTPSPLRGWLIVQGGTTELNDTADAVIRENINEVAQPSGTGTDLNAMHVNVANEFSIIAAKATLVAGDIFALEDSAAGNIKKRTTIASFDARYAELSGATFAGTLNLGSNAITNASSVAVTGNITVTGTVDGRDIDADGTALDVLVNTVIPFAFTLVPDHVSAAIGDQLWEAPYDIEITRIAVTALAPVTTGDFPINVRAGAGISNLPALALVGTVTLTAGSLQQAETAITPHAVSAGEHVVVEFGTITGTWTVPKNLMVYVHYKRA